MSECLVEHIMTGATDATGAKIDTVYGKVSGTYAVYRTSERVVVHYSDDASLAREQRILLTPLSALRGQINGLIDGWRSSKKHDKRAKATLFDRRVADALIVALHGDPDHARQLLTDLKADVLEERTSIARTNYLAAAAITAFGLVLLLWAWTFVDSASAAIPPPEAAGGLPFIFIAGVGAIGALFSIAIGIRSRTVLTDLQSRDNTADAFLRVLIGATSAVILFALLRAEFVTLAIFNRDGADLKDIDAGIVIAFLAGFSERLVGNLLGSISGGPDGKVANPLAGRDTPPAPARNASPLPAGERNPLGRAPAGV